VYHVARLVRVRREQDVVALADRVALHHVLQLVHPVLRVVRIQRALHDPEHLELLAEPKEYNTKQAETLRVGVALTFAVLALIFGFRL